jgi:protein-disulfide isomerase
VEESKEPRQEGSQEVPVPSGTEESGPGAGQQPPATSEDPAAKGRPGKTGVPGGPTGPAFDRQRYLLPGAVAAAVVAFAAVGIFALGMFTHSRFFNEGGGGQAATGGAKPAAGVVGTLKSYAKQLGLDTEAFNQCLDSDKYSSEVQKDEQEGITAGVQGTPAFFVNGTPLSGAQPYSVFQAAIDAALAGGALQPPAPTPTVVPVEVSAEDDPSVGPEDAPVTIIEFADYQCPYCERFYTQTFPQIIQNYGDRVRFVFRDFPLTSMHEYALKAAEASECADEQGKFWEYHDLLFVNQAALTQQLQTEGLGGQ